MYGRSRVVSMASLVVIGFASLASVSPAFATDPIAESNQLSSLDQQEIERFRQDFGLPTSQSIVDAVSHRPDIYSDTSYGIRLTPAEAAELDRRAEVQAAKGDAIEWAMTRDTFAGTYTDQALGGVPVFLFTKDLQSHVSEIAKALPPGAEFRVGQVARTLDSLHQQKASIDASWDALQLSGVAITMTGINTRENAVVVAIDGLTDAIAKRLNTDFGGDLQFLDRPAGQPDACISIDNCRPIKGGLGILTTANTTLCTLGFTARNLTNGTIVMVTAGHCIEAGGGLGVNWEHNNDSFGSGQKETWFDNSDADVGLIDPVSSEEPPTKNQFYAGSGTVSTITSFAYTFQQSQGDGVCRMGTGNSSERNCGTIKLVDVQNESCVAACKTIIHTIEMSFDSTGGDSGGTVFYGHVLMGTHVHSKPDGSAGAYGWYSPVDWGYSAYERAFGVRYRPCVTSAC